MYKLTWSQLSELYELCEPSSTSSMLHNTHTLRLCVPYMFMQNNIIVDYKSPRAPGSLGGYMH